MVYAILHTYGATVVNHGTRPDQLVAFYSRRERARWVADGPDYEGPGARSAVSAREAKRLFGAIALDHAPIGGTDYD